MQQIIPTATDAINWITKFLLLGQFLLSVLHLHLALCEGGGGGGREGGGQGGNSYIILHIILIIHLQVQQ
jgi:hypothetical protein